jgi:hypothetical protein
MRGLYRVLLRTGFAAGVSAVLVAAALASSGTKAVSLSRSTHAAGACGVERWTVKTLQDRPRLLPARKATIHYLITRRAPSSLPSTRLPFEHRVFTVVAAVVLVRPEDDSDFHVVLQQGGNHMISEAPAPYCTSRATPLRRRQMRIARSHVRLCAKARVTGVAFFDFDHGQTGVAPNAIELHPILGFRCLTS